MTPIHKMEFSTRVSNVCANENIETLKDLLQFDDRQLMRLPYFGWKSLREVKEKLQSMGLSIGMEAHKLESFSSGKCGLANGQVMEDK